MIKLIVFLSDVDVANIDVKFFCTNFFTKKLKPYIFKLKIS